MNGSLHKSGNIQRMNLDYLDWFDKFAKNAALIIGAFLVYRRYLKGRAYKTRIEPSISCVLSEEDGKQRILVTTTLTNKGIFSADMPSNSWWLQVFYPEEEVETDIQSIEWCNDIADEGLKATANPERERRALI